MPERPTHPRSLSVAAFALTTIPLIGLDFMVKDSKRFADSGGWGWGPLTMTPRLTRSHPPP